MARVYRTKAFNPSVAEKHSGGENIARLLGIAIGEVVSEGWIYQGLEDVAISVNPGCLGFMSGPKTVHYGVLVFYRDVS